MRIIQRFGRIDRIGSPNSQIQLVNYWPDITLDEYINLKERVENRKRSLGLTFCLRCRRAILRLTEIYAGVLRWGLRGSFSGTMA